MNIKSLMRLVCVATCLVISADLFAGKEWKSGYLVTNSNDTLRGLIALRGNGNNWENCLYKMTPDASEQLFTPNEVRCFLYDSKLFYKSMDIHTGRVNRRMFVRSLVDGLCSLSNLEMQIDADSTYNLFLAQKEENGKVIVLPEIKKFKLYATNTKRMKATLNVLFENHPFMQRDLDKLDLSINCLVRIFKKYNDVVCNDTNCVVYYEPKKVPRKFYFSVYGGPRITGTLAQGEPIDLLYKLNSKKMSYIVGAMGSMTLDKHANRSLLNVGLAFSPLSMSQDDRYARMLDLSVGLDIRINDKHSIPVRLSRYADLLGILSSGGHLRTSCYQLTVGCSIRNTK